MLNLTQLEKQTITKLQRNVKSDVAKKTDKRLTKLQPNVKSDAAGKTDKRLTPTTHLFTLSGKPGRTKRKRFRTNL